MAFPPVPEQVISEPFWGSAMGRERTWTEGRKADARISAGRRIAHPWARKPDLIIFDYDGVVADSEILSHAALAWRSFALPHPGSSSPRVPPHLGGGRRFAHLNPALTAMIHQSVFKLSGAAYPCPIFLLTRS